MRVRILSGQQGGRFIESPGNERTHPMGERMRGAMFNIIGPVDGLKVLDAFAGTGAVGLEAASRGAAQVVMIERDKIAQKVIDKNITTLGLQGRCTLIRASVSAWSGTSQEQFDLIIADPPYHDLQIPSLEKLVTHLTSKGLMILSYPGRESAPTVNGVVVVDNRSYGDAALAFYRLG